MRRFNVEVVKKVHEGNLKMNSIVGTYPVVVTSTQSAKEKVGKRIAFAKEVFKSHLKNGHFLRVVEKINTQKNVTKEFV